MGKEQHEFLEVMDVSKTFPNGVQASKGVSFSLKKGEILGLVGENGAGKTTLMHILYGMETPDTGKIFLDGEEETILNPHDAISKGIGMVHQHFMLVPEFSGTVNIVLGVEPRKKNSLGFDLQRANQKVRELARRFSMDIDLDSPVEKLSVADQQRVEILKALYRDVRILILDEPTDVLTPQEVDPFFKIIKDFVSEGKSVILVTHKLNEIFTYTNRIAILRKGELVNMLDTDATDLNMVVQQMVGSTKVDSYIADHNSIPHSEDDSVFTVKNLSVRTKRRHSVKHVSLTVGRGEIVCIAGVEGNGQTEFVEAIAGMIESEAGEVYIDGKNISSFDVAERRKAGMVHIPENRMTTGICENLELDMNLVMGHHRKSYLSNRGKWKESKVQLFSQNLVKEFNIVTNSVKTTIKQLSGGNIQKAIIAREFSHSATRLAVISQPTRGLDIRSVWYVHKRLQALADSGIGLLVVSSDLDEVLAIADRIFVLFDGEIAAEFTYSEADKEKLGYFMAGSHLVLEKRGK